MAVASPAAADVRRGRFRGDRFLRAAATTSFLRVLARALALPTTILLARTLGAASYGRYAYALAWATLLGLAAVAGMDRYVVRAIARYGKDGDFARARGVLTWALGLASVSALTLVAAFAALMPVFMKHEYRGPTSLALILVPVAAVTLVRQAVLQAVGRVEVSFVPEQTVYPGVLLVGVVAVVLLQPFRLNTWNAVSINVAASCVAFVAGIALLRRGLPVELRHTVARYEPRAWTRGLVPFAAIGLVGLAQGQVGVLLLGSLSPAREVGAFQIAARLAEFASFALVAVNASLAPAIARLDILTDREAMRSLVARTAWISFAICAPIVAGLVLLREPVLRLFGSSYASASTALVILALAQLVNAAIGPVGVLLMMTGGERRAAAAMAFSLALGAAVTLALAHRLGATGAAIGSAGALMTWNVMLWVGAVRRLEIDTSLLGGFLRRRRR